MLVSVLNKFRHLFLLDKPAQLFIEYNRTFFGHQSKNIDRHVLVEITTMHSSQIALSRFAHALNLKYPSSITAYSPLPSSLHYKILFKYTSLARVYQSFSDKFLHSFSLLNKNSLRVYNFIVENVLTKQDLIDLCIDGIYIGDLIYDHYIITNRLPTVDFNSHSFKDCVKSFAVMYEYWMSFFSANSVTAVLVTHTCYLLGLPARIAIQMKIPAYEVKLTDVYRLSQENPYSHANFYTYKEIFDRLPLNTKKHALSMATQSLRRIYEGKQNFDQPYMTHSAYKSDNNCTTFISRKKNVRILIAPHCFLDNPHPYGKHLFPDFYEWFHYLGNLALQTDYEWYVKSHPGTFIENLGIIDQFCSLYPFTHIPHDTSHNQLIEEGINFVLTIYGSIGLEYAARGITVLNASFHNPHISFSFNLHPRSFREYSTILQNAEKYLTIPIDMDQVRACYFMKYLYYNKDIMSKLSDSFRLGIQPYTSNFTTKSYCYWLSNISSLTEDKLQNLYRRFIDSGCYNIKELLLDDKYL